MIEVNSSNEEFLPKNVRQIGEIQEDKKIYIEDYAENYMNQVAGQDELGSKIFILVGQTLMQNDKQYIFINGAILLNAVDVYNYRSKIDDDAWNYVYEIMRKYFENWEIVGWALAQNEFRKVSEDSILRTQLDYFSKANMVMLELSMWDNEKDIYMLEMGSMQKQPGHYVYFSKSNNMHMYMLDELSSSNIAKEKKQPKEAAQDHAVRQFRTLMHEKREESFQKKTMVFLYTASTFLVMVVFVIGITMINNYDKMKDMEKSIEYITQKIHTNNENVQPVMATPKEESENSLIINEEQLTASDANNIVIENNFAKEDKVIENVITPEEEIQLQPDNLQTDKEAADLSEIKEEPALPEGKDEIAMEKEVDIDEIAVEKKHETYIIKKGDTLNGISIAVYHNDKMVDEICALNNITDVDKIKQGQKILLP